MALLLAPRALCSIARFARCDVRWVAAVFVGSGGTEQRRCHLLLQTAARTSRSDVVVTLRERRYWICSLGSRACSLTAPPIVGRAKRRRSQHSTMLRRRGGPIDRQPARHDQHRGCQQHRNHSGSQEDLVQGGIENTGRNCAGSGGNVPARPVGSATSWQSHRRPRCPARCPSNGRTHWCR